jgi:predicted NAD/FAD-dependent oxidoreductase
MKRLNIAVIGAGMAGLTAATDLKASGHGVTVYDKARGPGGRMSTRRQATPAGEVAFDHGAPAFTALDADFRAQIETWSLSGVVGPWQAAGEGVYVGVPGMNAPLKAMAAGLDCRWSVTISELVAGDAGWRLAGAEGDGPFDAIILAIPAEQAAVLLADLDAGLAARARASVSTPCWSLMLAFDGPVATASAVVEGQGGAAWAGRQTSKPGRSGPESWVVQASPDWSAVHLELTPDAAAGLMLEQFQAAVGSALPGLVSAVAHRWRYARAGSTEGPAAVWVPGLALGVCGDWLGGSSVEGAWRSGRAVSRLLTTA